MENINIAEVDAMSVETLKLELEKRGQDIQGTKPFLKFRLMQLVQKEADDQDDENDDTKSSCEFPRRHAKFKDVEEMVDAFSGDGTVMIESWLNELEEVNSVTRFDDDELLIIARRLLTGPAKRFIRSQRGIISWVKFKQVLLDEFKTQVCAKDVHYELRQRKKKVSEPWRDYLYEMMEIGARIDLDQTSIIGYIVDGVEDNTSDKMVLYGAKTLSALKERFETYDRLKKKSASSMQNKSVGKARYVERKNDRDCRRCFNCGMIGHQANGCPDTKKGPKCYRCQQFGHLSAKCTVVAKNVNLVQEQRNFVIGNIRGYEWKMLVDSGSPVSLMRIDVANNMRCKIETGTTKSFTGLGSATIKPLGCLNEKIEIQNEEYDVKFYVVPMDDMSVSLLLGDDVLQQAEVTFGSNGVAFKKHEKADQKVDEEIDAMLSVNVLSDEVDIDAVEPYADQLRQIIENYTVSKDLKSTDIETKIILTEDTPIYQKPRRLAPLEKSVLQKQIKQWLNDGVIIPSKSEFSSPVVIVRKKCGDYRVCIDYRRNRSKEQKGTPKTKAQKQRKRKKKKMAVMTMKKMKLSRKKKSRRWKVKLRTACEQNVLAIVRQELVESFDEGREHLREQARKRIQEMQNKQKQQFDKNRRKATTYKVGDLVAIQRTQFGTGLKLKGKFLGPYVVEKCNENERYDVRKISIGEGPQLTSSAADLMKPWIAESSETDDP